jgi:hypothetical protein
MLSMDLTHTLYGYILYADVFHTPKNTLHIQNVYTGTTDLDVMSWLFLYAAH